MKSLYILFLMLSTGLVNVIASDKITIIPYPAEVELSSSEITLNSGVSIIAVRELSNEAHHLANILSNGFNKTSQLLNQGQGINLNIDKVQMADLGAEGYILEINDHKIDITAATATGIFYGIQSFRQLLPPEFEHSEISSVSLPELKIKDYPRFQWRSFMLDEARNFKGHFEVKRILDQMALLKLNKFHWHLTDDQGWRIEIMKYPKLTQVGSKRSDTQLSRKSEDRLGEPHQGFYTQDQIRDVIDYAKKLHISIIPEIEMPGHAMAAVAAYPWLGSLGSTSEVPVTFGKFDDSFRVSDPHVVAFLKNVLDEIMDLFPSPVIHIGGDEINYNTWKNSEEISAYMTANKIASPIDLQIAFTNDISAYIDSSGKRMMGWNDILGDDIHGDPGHKATQSGNTLSKSAVIHFWKGDLSLIEKAVKSGYDVVNSNHWDTYLDYTYKRLPLSKSYSFDPIPEGLEKKFHHQILGFGTQMWSEWIPSIDQMQGQIFPRLAAYAEVGWTMKNRTNFDRFKENLSRMEILWELEGISFYTDQNDE